MAQSRLYEYLKTNDPASLELLICEDGKEAHELADVAAYFDIECLVFPDLRAAYLDDLRPFKEELQELSALLRRYYAAEKKPLVVSPLKSLLFPLPKPELLQTRELAFGDRIDLNTFKEQMLCWGYSFVDMVQVEGEISFRGDIIDIYVPNTEDPYRISLFDDEVEEIKPFTLETQRTTGEECDTITIAPAFYALDETGYEAVNAKVQAAESDSFVKDVASLGLWFLGEHAVPFLSGKKARFVKPMDDLLKEVYALNDPQVERDAFELEVIAEEEKYKELAVTDIPTLLQVHKNKKVTIVATNDAQVKQANLFDTSGFTLKYAPYILNIIGPDEVVISLNKPVKKRRRRKSSILLDDLKPGDYVVHEDYGVGIFEKIEQAEILGG
ncbi:MAG: CarD family transcriptional regulator, partial [Sulfurimonadaceae bacterium]|nr:CarD family transcriptional regulator [Sulfurimonadaceae bacterium]